MTIAITVTNSPKVDCFIDPKVDEDYFVDPRVYQEVARLLKLTEQGPENLALVGPKGSGKTSLALQAAAMRRGPTCLVTAYAARSAEEWFGRETVDAEGMRFVPSAFVRALETEGATVIINDLALMQNRTVQNGLNDLLDYSIREAWIPGLDRMVRVADRVLIIATWNEGSEYTGNIPLAANIQDRFPNRIWIGYPPAEVRVSILTRKTGLDYFEAMRLVNYADRLRSMKEPVEVSLRGVLQAAKKLRLGASFKDALYFSVVGGLHPRQQEQALLLLEELYTEEEAESDRAPRDWELWSHLSGGAQ